MLKTYLYIPDELNKRISQAAKDQKKSKAEVIREALSESLGQPISEELMKVDETFYLNLLEKTKGSWGKGKPSKNRHELELKASEGRKRAW